MTAPLPRGIPADVVKREWIEAHIERLIALLDWTDGDPDREPTMAGYPPRGGVLDECEPIGDVDEPELGWPEEVEASAGSVLDGEDEAADDEPEAI